MNLCDYLIQDDRFELKKSYRYASDVLHLFTYGDRDEVRIKVELNQKETADSRALFTFYENDKFYEIRCRFIDDVSDLKEFISNCETMYNSL